MATGPRRSATPKGVEPLTRRKAWKALHRDYRDSVLSPAVSTRIAIEQASTFGWERYVGSYGQIIGMKTFGASAPLKELQNKFGFEPDRLVAAARDLLGRGKS